MTLIVLPAAELEASDGAASYDARRNGLGDEFLDELFKAYDRIRANSRSLARAEFYTGGREIRRCMLNRFPYLVVYECRGPDALILAVSHVRRRPLYWLDRLY